MSGAHINYKTQRKIERIVDAGVIGEIGDDSELEIRHITELEDRMKALDDKEVFVVINTLVKYHREIFVKTLEYLEKEGEEQ